MAIFIQLPLPDLFSSLVKGLLNDVLAVAPKGWAKLPLIRLLWWRLRRMNAKFTSIMAQYEAGTLPPPAPRSPPAPASLADASPPSHGSSPAATPRPSPGLRVQDPSRRVGWVIQVIPGAEVWASQFKDLLADANLPTAVANAPQLGSVLRPMCRSMAVRQPPWLRLPRAPRPPRPPAVQKHPPAPDWLVASPGAILKPDGTVWMRFGASTNWRPGHPETLEEMQKFDYPVRIWPRD